MNKTTQLRGNNRVVRRFPAQARSMRLTQDQKLDEALKQTFPASDAFYLAPDEEAGRKPLEQKKQLRRST